MLTELRIDNFAIIDHLSIELKPGLITFTGETGAGKSIIIDAVQTLLGGRTDTTMIRTGAKKASIEGTFYISPQLRDAIHAILKRERLLDDPEYFTLAREIKAEGRNVARVNGHPVSLGLQREIGELIVDVHGQSEHLSLLHVRQHLLLLDRFASSEALLEPYRNTYRQFTTIRKEIQDLRIAESESARKIDLLDYQINEIESARLFPDEEDNLRAERTRLANAESLASLVQKTIVSLDEGTIESPSVIDLIGQSSNDLDSLVRLDPSQIHLAEQIKQTFENLTELTRELRRYQEEIEFNPKRLDEIEERLDLISRLKRKYGATIGDILAFLDNAKIERETIQTAGERITELESLERNLLVGLGRLAQTLSEHRQNAARQLEQAVEHELSDLRMSGAEFKVDLRQPSGSPSILLEDGRQVGFDASGIDQVEFLLAANPGEGLKPLIKVASGGEASRLMLALKDVLAEVDHIPTLIFDEIDQGIGGRVGAIIGQKMWTLARHHQVLCVTHLPQLAAFGDQHIQVNKQIKESRTITQIAEVSGEARVVELAQMMGVSNPENKKSATEMLRIAQEKSQ
jgi:DNA repair protein RecN (Recombination protein N)